VKHQLSKRALEGTHNGYVLGGSCGPREAFRRFYFKKVTEVRRLILNTHGIGYQCRKPETLSGCPLVNPAGEREGLYG